MEDTSWDSLLLLSQFLVLFWGYKRLKIQLAIEDRWNRIGFFGLLSAPICHSVSNTYKFETHAVGILIAMGLAIHSYRTHYKWLLLMSILNVVLCLTYYFDFITELYRRSPWVFYAIVGIGLILISAFYDRIVKFTDLLRTRRHCSLDRE